jgi:hypothetical protein
MTAKLLVIFVVCSMTLTDASYKESKGPISVIDEKGSVVSLPPKNYIYPEVHFGRRLNQFCMFSMGVSEPSKKIFEVSTKPDLCLCTYCSVNLRCISTSTVGKGILFCEGKRPLNCLRCKKKEIPLRVHQVACMFSPL